MTDHERQCDFNRFQALCDEFHAKGYTVHAVMAEYTPEHRHNIVIANGHALDATHSHADAIRDLSVAWSNQVHTSQLIWDDELIYSVAEPSDN